jgi:hypothetical protein
MFGVEAFSQLDAAKEELGKISRKSSILQISIIVYPRATLNF